MSQEGGFTFLSVGKYDKMDGALKNKRVGLLQADLHIDYLNYSLI